jgi:hypothetical protein
MTTITAKAMKHLLNARSAIMGISLFGLFFADVFGQASISGSIEEENGNPLPFANVLLLNAQDSTLVKGMVTCEKGIYSTENIIPGEYMINASMVGYQSACLPPFQLAANSGQIHLSRLVLKEDVSELSEVVIKGQKPLYEMQMDRLVINVQNSITSAGSSVLEVLRKSPGVMVDEQNNTISMYGKSGVVVMINEKISRLPVDAMVQMMKGMSAANIERIELITQPPSKYEAEGTAGIIHIVMKESADLGTNGTIGFNLGYNWAETAGTNFNLNHRKEKFSAFVNYSLLYDHNIHLEGNYKKIHGTDFTSELISEGDKKHYLTIQNLNSGFEYKLNKKSGIETLVYLYKRHWSMIETIASTEKSPKYPTIETEMMRDMYDNWRSITANIGMYYLFNEHNKLRFDIGYLLYHNDNPSIYKNDIFNWETNTAEREELTITKESPIDFKIAKLDYQFSPSKKFQLEMGIKGATSGLDNNIIVQRLQNWVWITDPLFSSLARSSEHILSGYLSIQSHLSSKIQLNTGLRYEHTDTYLTDVYREYVVDRNFGNFFPNIVIRKSFSKQSNFQIGYSRRITRPTYDQLAGNVKFFNPATFATGNPALRPAIMDAYKINYQIKQVLISLNYDHTQNAIRGFQPTFLKEKKTEIRRPENFKYSKMYYLSLTVPFNFNPWWDVNPNLIVAYGANMPKHLERNNQLNVFGYYLNMTNNIRLPNDYSFELSGYYMSRWLWGIRGSNPYYTLNIGAQKQLAKDWGTLRFLAQDVLHTLKTGWTYMSPDGDIVSRGNYDMHVRSIMVTYTKPFGNKKLKKVNLRSGLAEEQRRAGAADDQQD